jgi:hypothetical protein
MPVRTWRFFHPNDGTIPYQDNDPERNRVFYERIDYLEETVQRQSIRIDELNSQLQEYQGRVFYTLDNED